jgi:alpha-1,6-mannosyltransferase
LTAYLLLFLAGALLSIFAARSLSASGLGFLLLCAAAFRLTMLLHQSDLSDDVYRYVWDGKVATTGRSPYAFAPDDPQVAELFPELRARVAHRELRTVYPPVAQAVFRVAAKAPGAGVLAMKAILGAADVAIVALLFAGGGAGARFGAALYAFHPLAVTESAGQGHLDSLGVALLLAALIYLGRRRPVAAGVAFAGSVLTKYVPLAAVLPFARRGGWKFAAATLVTGATVWGLATRGAADRPIGALGDYATRWEFNSLLYPAVSGAIESSHLPEKAKAAYIRWKEGREQRPWMQRVFPYFYTSFFARVALALLLTLVLVGIAARGGEPESAVFASLGAFLLVSPTLHPWYLLWVLPFAAKRREPAFLYLSCAAPLSYGLLYPLGGLTPAAIRLLEYVPFAVLLGMTLWRSRRESAKRG